VEFAERGETTGDAITKIARDYLQTMKDAKVDTLVLGCTHYPLLTGVISYVMGNDVSLVSSADETAKDLYRILVEKKLLNVKNQQQNLSPKYKFVATNDAKSFANLARRFLGPEVVKVEEKIN
jgi:glutamate racemase